MSEPVDLTKCQLGDLLKLRNGCNAVYLYTIIDDTYKHRAAVNDGSNIYTDDGSDLAGHKSSLDVIAIIHPTRAELEEQRRELLVAVKGALAALSQPMTYPADIAAAKRWLADAAIKAEATHG